MAGRVPCCNLFSSIVYRKWQKAVFHGVRGLLGNTRGFSRFVSPSPPFLGILLASAQASVVRALCAMGRLSVVVQR